MIKSDTLIPALPGIYIIFIENLVDQNIIIGSIGLIHFKKGFFAYVGSALGGGGLRPRVERHLRKRKKIFWHLDYLTTNEHFEITTIVLIPTSNKLECQINRIIIDKLEKLNESETLKNFGSSDCKCHSHLHFLGKNKNSVIVDDIVKSIRNKSLEVIYLDKKLNENSFEPFFLK